MRDHRRRRTNFPQSTIHWVLAEIGLLLICGFLVIGDIDDGPKGIKQRLLPWTEEAGDTLRVPSSQCLTVTIGADETIVAEGDTLSHLVAYKHLVTVLSETRVPVYRYVTFTYSDSTSYRTFMLVYDAIIAGREARYDEVSLRLYDRRYSEDMPFAERKEILKAAAITIAEEWQTGMFSFTP